jgi:hypothetical protein
MVNTLLLDEWDRMLWLISEEVSEGYPDVDPQDLFSAVYGLLLEVKTVWKSLGHPRADAEAYLRSECAAYAWNIRAEQLRMTSQYAYRVQDVSEIMETVFDREDWPSGFTPPDAKTGERDRMAPLEVRMDACYGYGKLPEELREILIRRYHDKIVDHVASPRGEALQYALTRLTEEMNRYRG